MFKTVEDFQQLSRTQLEATTQSAAAVSRGLQQIALEASDLSKRTIEESSAAFGKMIGVRSLDGALQVQTDYAKTACENAVTGATRFGELFASLAKDAYRPFEGAMEQAQTYGK